MSVHEPKLAYTIAEACQQLGNITRQSLYRLFEAGELKSVQLGTRRLVRHSDLLDFLERNTVDDTRPGESLSARATAARNARLAGVS
jgi:excisionase family DNA binding protein